MLVLVLALVVGSCGHSSASAPDRAAHATPKDDPSCPVLVPGTSVTVEDMPTAGAALVFVTTGDVAQVRQRATRLADMHNKHDGPASAMGMMITTSSTANEADVDNGARVELVANKPDDVGSLQSELRMHAKHLASGSCEMAM